MLRLYKIETFKLEGRCSACFFVVSTNKVYALAPGTPWIEWLSCKEEKIFSTTQVAGALSNFYCYGSQIQRACGHFHFGFLSVINCRLIITKFEEQSNCSTTVHWQEPLFSAWMSAWSAWMFISWFCINYMSHLFSCLWCLWFVCCCIISPSLEKHRLIWLSSLVVVILSRS